MSEHLSQQDVVASYEYYRSLYESPDRHQGIETEGIFDLDVFGVALHDPQSSVLESAAEGRHVSLPLLTPLANVSWFNMDYHHRHAGSDVPLVHYSHLSLAYARDPGAYKDAFVSGLEDLAANGGVIVFDHIETHAHAIRRELHELLGGTALTLSVVEGPEGPATRHYHYADIAVQPDGTHTRSDPPSLYDVFAAARQSGEIPDDIVSLIPSLSPDDREQLWQFYKPVFDDLTHDDPVHAGLTRQEFDELMKSPDCIKFIYKTEGTIINAFFLMGVQRAPWMNQSYYRQRYPKEYEQGQVLYSPGIIRNPRAGRLATSLHTMGMASKVIRLSGTEPVITFVCDTESNKNVPGLTQRALTRAGLTTQLGHPIDYQWFRMLRVER